MSREADEQDKCAADPNLGGRVLRPRARDTPEGLRRLMTAILRANGKKTVRETAAALKRHLERG
jgi:hypothetical protein